MRWSGRLGSRRASSLKPLVLGFALGILLSIGLRMLSNPCGTRRDVLTDLEGIDAVSADARMESQGEAGILADVGDPVKNYDQPDPLGEAMPSGSGKSFLELDRVQLNNYSSGDRSPGGISRRPQLKTKQRKLLLVGVMTAEKYLNSRVIGVFETWAQDIPGRVIFFTGANSSSRPYTETPGSSQDFALVALQGVDDSYPPQKKSFMMLKYMYDHYGDEYEWFMRADDDVYVKAEKLAEFLRSINSRQLYFIGQAGRGNRAEKGTLNLAHNENFCMGGPGIILSRVALAKVAPYVKQCLQNMYSTHEDVEVGRCVRRFAGVSCTWAYEMQSIFYHNSSGDAAFTGNLKRPEVHRGLTLHPVKDFRHMYRLHSYVQSLNIQELLFESLLVQRDLLALDEEDKLLLSQRKLQDPKTSGASGDFKELEDLHIHGLQPSLNKFQPQNESEIINWSFLGKGIYSAESSNPKQKIDGSMKESLEDVVRDLMDIINGFSRARGRIIDFKEILYGYHRVNPLYGEEFVLDLLMTYKKYRGRKMTVPVRRHAYIQRPFAPLQLNLVLPSESSPTHASSDGRGNKGKKLVLILPLSGRLSAFRRFLEDFKTSCAGWTSDFKEEEEKSSLQLKIVYFDRGDMEDRNQFFSIINSFREANAGLRSCQIQIVQMDGEFSRSIALETGISQCGENDLLFLIDVDISFTFQALERVLRNTVQGQRVYFPIVFSEYNFNFLNQIEDFATNSTIQEVKGYWRDYGFGIAGFYKSDFRRAGGFDTSIQGWGKEDVSLYERFISETNLTIFRAPDPALVHIYHDITCDDKLSPPQYDMCLGTQANTLGSSRNLMKYIFYQRPAGHVKRFLEQSASNLNIA